MSRKPTKGYYVKGHFVAQGSELDLELQREVKGHDLISKTDLKQKSNELQKLGEDLLDLVTTHEVGPLRISHTVSTYSNASESASAAAAADCVGTLTPAGAQRIAAVDEPPVP